MSKRFRLILSAGACAASIGALSYAANAQQAAPPSQQSTEQRGMTRGENLRAITVMVTNVDRAQHKVTFEARVFPEASIKSNGTPIMLDELNEGDSLRVLVDPAKGEVVSTTVTKQRR
jgi:hypothetical protein